MKKDLTILDSSHCIVCQCLNQILRMKTAIDAEASTLNMASEYLWGA